MFNVVGVVNCESVESKQHQQRGQIYIFTGWIAKLKLQNPFDDVNGIVQNPMNTLTQHCVLYL